MVWGKPQDQITDCYFCVVSTEGIGKKNWNKISYPSIFSAFRPIPHCIKQLIPGFAEGTKEKSSKKAHISINTEIVPESEILLEYVTVQSTPQQFCQTELYDLVRNLDLSKKVSEILILRLQEKHLLNNSAKVSYFLASRRNFHNLLFRKKAVCLLS